MNTPYKKEFDENGDLMNPITGSYMSEEPNRKTRRQRVGRFHGNGKNHHLTVTETRKYRRIMQLIEYVKDGIFYRKTVNHYV